MIAIIDYGVGNLFSLGSSLKFLGIDSVVTDNENEIDSADKIILPGVGAFGDAITRLREKRLDKVLDRNVSRGKPLLGICLGMQLLFEESFEYGHHKGLGYISGSIAPLCNDISLKVPHMGWNSLDIVKPDPILKYTKAGDCVYFVHSYYGKNCADSLVATASYGVPVTAIVRNKNVTGTQFHPEKSGKVGLDMLRAFNEDSI